MLEEYKPFFATLAGLLTVGQQSSGLFLCRSIYKAGSTKTFPPTPFIGGTVISILFLQHGRLLKDATVGFVNIAGIIINLFCLTFYLTWSDAVEKKVALKQLGIGMGIVAVLLGYAQIEDPELVQVRFGTVVCGILLTLVANPLFRIRTIIRTRNTDIIPFPMTVSGILMSTSWILYAISANQMFVVYQHLIFLCITIPQFILCLIYPSSRGQKEKSS